MLICTGHGNRIALIQGAASLEIREDNLQTKKRAIWSTFNGSQDTWTLVN